MSSQSAGRARSAKSTPRCAPSWPASKSAAAAHESCRCASGFTAASTLAPPRTSSAARTGAHGRRARPLLADNIELDQTRRAPAPKQVTAEAEGRASSHSPQETSSAPRSPPAKSSLKTLRAPAREAQEKRSQIELELVRSQAELKYLDETSRKELGASLAALAEGDRDRARRARRRRGRRAGHQEVRGRIEALGPVNPQALRNSRKRSSATTS